jgi:hypothetical protein
VPRRLYTDVGSLRREVERYARVESALGIFTSDEQ